MSATSLFWRRLAYAGARYGPRAFLEHSPALFGVAALALMPEQRRTIRRCLQRACGPRPALREHWDVVRTFANYAHCLAESLGRERPEARHARVTVEGREHLSEALAGGGGLVLVTAHCGAWDAVGSLLRRDHDREVVLVMTGEQDERARALHDAVRARSGVTVVHVGGHALDALPLIRKLAGGAVVAIQLDRVTDLRETLEVELFGLPFEVPKGPFVLGALARVPVVPVFCRRRSFYDYEVVASPPIRLPRRPDDTEIRRAAQEAARAMERFLRRSPTQWFHFAL